MPKSSLQENFQAKIQKDEGKWRWTGSVNNSGYPKIKDHGKLRLASHVSLELAGRKAPGPGQVAMHLDNNPRNVNPSNLRVGTQKQNLKAMRDQGRDRPRGVTQEPDVKTAEPEESLWRKAGRSALYGALLGPFAGVYLAKKKEVALAQRKHDQLAPSKVAAVTEPLSDPEQWMVNIAGNAFKKTPSPKARVKMAAFVDEMQKIWG